MVIHYDDEDLDIKKVFQVIAASVALALAIFIAVWVIDYFNASNNMDILSNISLFLTTYWSVIVGFVFLISLWDYVYPIYRKKLKYVKPIIEATSIMFGLWIVATFLKGLLVIVNVGDQAAPFLTLLHDLYFQQFAVLYLLFIFIGYSRFFLGNK